MDKRLSKGKNSTKFSFTQNVATTQKKGERII